MTPLARFSSPLWISWQDPPSCDWLHCAFRMSQHVKSLNMTKTQLLKPESCLSKLTYVIIRFVKLNICRKNKHYIRKKKAVSALYYMSSVECVHDDVHIVVRIRGWRLETLNGLVWEWMVVCPSALALRWTGDSSRQNPTFTLRYLGWGSNVREPKETNSLSRAPLLQFSCRLALQISQGEALCWWRVISSQAHYIFHVAHLTLVIISCAALFLPAVKSKHLKAWTCSNARREIATAEGSRLRLVIPDLQQMRLCTLWCCCCQLAVKRDKLSELFFLKLKLFCK